MQYVRWSVLLLIVMGTDPVFFGGLLAQEDTAAKPELENLLRAELEGVEGIEVIVSLIEVPPETTLPRHYHPGEEFVYIIEGSGTLWPKDEPDMELKAGDVAKVPLHKVHTAVTGDSHFKALVFRVHKVGEPERILSE